MIRVIIVDDHPVVRRGLKQIIAAEQDMQVVGEAEKEVVETLQQLQETREMLSSKFLVAARAIISLKNTMECLTAAG